MAAYVNNETITDLVVWGVEEIFIMFPATKTNPMCRLFGLALILFLETGHLPIPRRPRLHSRRTLFEPGNGDATPNAPVDQLEQPGAAEVHGNVTAIADPVTGEVTVLAPVKSEFTVQHAVLCEEEVTPFDVVLLAGDHLFPMEVLPK